MFCPQCGAENSLEQKYCRRCGLQLTAARISLQGGVGEALTRHKKGEVLLSLGGVTLVIFILVALANIFLDSGPYPVLINLLLGLVIAVPLMAAGLLQLRRAGRALHPQDEQSQLAADQPDDAWAIRSSAYSTDRLLSPTKVPDSVTEQTTLHLKSPEQGTR
jgi:hypothetical protein